MINPDARVAEKTIADEINHYIGVGALFGGTFSQVVGNMLIRHRVVDAWAPAIDIAEAGAGALVVGGVAATILEVRNETRFRIPEQEFLNGNRRHPY